MKIQEKIEKIFLISLFIMVLFCMVKLGNEMYSQGREFAKPKVEVTKKESLVKPRVFDFRNFLLKSEIMDVKRQSLVDDASILETMYEQHKAPTYEQLKSHIVYITGIVPDKKYENYMIERGKSWVGTGFVFKTSDKYTWIITNKHVAGIFANREGETTELYIGDTEEERVKAKIVRFHPKYDVALLVVYGKLEGKTQIKGLSTAKPQDKVYLVGHHLGRQYIYGEGVFAGYEESGDLTYDVIQVPVLFGNSGSAVFDQNGHVVSLVFAVNGITMFCVDGAHGLAAPGEILQEFLKNWSF